MRVGFLIDRWEPSRGGAERAMARLATHLSERGHDVHAFARRASDGAPGTFHRVDVGLLASRARRERALGEALVRAAEEAACDVTVGLRHLPRVDVYWPHGGAYGPSLEARLRAHGREAPRVPRGRHRVFLDFERQLVQEGGARRIVCVSDAVRGELASTYPGCESRLEVIQNGVELDVFHPRRRAEAITKVRAELGLSSRTGPLLAFVARDPALKGLPYLFDALAPLTRAWTLVVAGTRHPRRWERVARERGIDPARVVAARELRTPDLFAAADLTLLPTWRDPAPLVLLESLACGTPVVTTSLAGNSSLVAGDDVGAVLSRPDDVAALRAAIAEWLDRIAEGALDRDRVRAAVAERGVAAWLHDLERVVVS